MISWNKIKLLGNFIHNIKELRFIIKEIECNILEQN